MTEPRTWEISDIDGTNKRTVTLAQFRAELDAAAARAKAKHAKDREEMARYRAEPNHKVQPDSRFDY